jgi:hypothetical protein
MNNKTAKKIRRILPPTDAISRRNYRRAKKVYTRLSKDAKPVFLEHLSKLMQSN